VANYIKATNFAVKDSLNSGDPLKVVKGTEIDTEFNNIASAVASKVDADSPTFTGTPTAPTASQATNNTQIATTAYVTTKVADKANIDSPTFTGTPAAPTPSSSDNSTRIATTSYVTTNLNNGLALKANLASPAFTGVPTAPTPSTGTENTQIATTAYVANKIGAIAAGVSSFSAGTTGLTPNTSTTGNVTLSGTLAIANGGTGSTTASAARTALSVPSTTGSGASGTWGISITGNAATATSATTAANGGVTSVNAQTGAVVTTNFDGVGSVVIAYYAVNIGNASAYYYLATGTTASGSNLRLGTNTTGNTNSFNEAGLLIGRNIPTQSTIPPLNSINKIIISGTASPASTAFPTTGTQTLSGTWRSVSGTLYGISLADGDGLYWYAWIPLLWMRVS
jgi:hypothetical protein